MGRRNHVLDWGTAVLGTLPWQPFLAFYIWGAHWRHLVNTTEPSMCGGDAALCQIALFDYLLFLEALSKIVIP